MSGAREDEAAHGRRLTSVQLGALYDSTFADRPSVGVEQFVCHFDDEAVDVSAMRSAWQVLQDRHPVLRSTFRVTDVEQPAHVLDRDDRLDIVVEDWSSCTHDDQLTKVLTADRARGVDLDGGRGWRVDWLLLGPRRSLLVWTVHRVVIDRWTASRLIGELLDAYDHVRRGEASADVVAPSPPADRLAGASGPDRDAAEAHVRRVLAGFTAPNDLGLEAPVVPVAQRLRVERVIDQPAARATPAAIAASWAVVVGRYGRSRDVVVGVEQVALDELAGAPTDPLPIRVGLEPELTVGELLSAVDEQQAAIGGFAGIGMIDVHRWSDVGRAIPLFTSEVIVELGEAPSTSRRIDRHGESPYVIELSARLGTRVALQLDVDGRSVGRAAAERLLDHVANVLVALCSSSPEVLVRDIEMLSPAERSHLLDGLNPPPAVVVERCVPDLFEEQVLRTPHAAALRVARAGSDTTLTFAQLDRRANQLAHAVRGAGVRPDQRVAICLPRSVAFVESMLAVMKSGAAYVPIDPAYPDHVVQHMLVDSGASLLITTGSIRDEIADILGEHRIQTLLVDRDAHAIELRPDLVPPRDDLEPHHLAYVIYTSGSTGAPKGVGVEHRSLATYAAAIVEHYELTDTDRVLQFASLSFDVSIEEIVPTLLSGAVLVLRDDSMAESIRSFLEAVEHERLSVINLPSAYWHLLVQHLEERGAAASFPSCVRLVIVGGEKPARWAYDVWSRSVPGVRWLNGYGPTEATVTCAVYDPTGRRELGAGREIPIGSALGNSRLYVLGLDGSPVPEGVVGELWVGGAGVARGYLGRPELTAERFRPDPFVAPSSNARMYATGDLARWLPSGDLEFLGRIDRQIKLRGFRMEPGEIEAVLEASAAIGHAFVAVHRSGGDREILTAWVTPARVGAAIDAEALLLEVRGLLPAHMVPSVVVPVAMFPITAGGKIDVSALPSPAPPLRLDVAQRARTDGQAPVDDPTVTLARELFADVLQLDRVGADESFFDLGGHSLLAVRLIDRLERATGRRISLPTLFGAPTPRDVARAIHEIAAGSQYDYLLPIQPEGDRPPLIGVHVLGTNAEFYKPLAEHLGPDQPVFGLSISNPGVSTPTDVRMIARLYAAELYRFHPHGPLHLAAVSLGAFVAFELAQQLVANGRKVVTLALFDAAGPGPSQQVSRRERIGHHLRRVRAEGIRYVLGRIAGRMRHAARCARLAAYEVAGRPIPDSLWELKFIQANQIAADHYEIAPYPGSITVFHAEDEVFDAEAFKQSGLGWNELAAGGIDVVGVPGGHLSMLAEPHVEVLAAELRKAMERDDDTDP